ncbi:hypothetical protein ACWD2L_00705 [Streptomyces sp. NPDC002754]
MNHALTVTLTRHCPDRPPMESIVGVTEYEPGDPGILASLVELLDAIADEICRVAITGTGDAGEVAP